MNNFGYVRAATVEEALHSFSEDPQAIYLAGGTNLVDHLKLGIARPSRLIDIRRLGLDQIQDSPHGGLSIGAGVTNSKLAYDEWVISRYPALSQAILSGAGPQLRNVATVAGNLLQGVRCYYFRDGHSPCNRRNPGSGCSAAEGFNRIHAILGTSDKCIATHPSDMAVAMVAFAATVRTWGPNGERSIPIGEFFVPWGTVLERGELIVGVDLPPTPWFARSTYVKARDRASFEFALASAAVAVDLRGGVIHDCRIALGGVATTPWRAHVAESVLRGTQPGDRVFGEAAAAELAPAVPWKHNGFKIELCNRVIVDALKSICSEVGA